MTENLLKSSIVARIGLAMIACSSVLLELTLTRLFSAIVSYHFAFMIVSITMFGMTAGALLTFGKSSGSVVQRSRLLILYSFLFCCAVPLAYIAHLHLNDCMANIGPFAWTAASFILFSIPFCLAGTVVCLCLTGFADVGTLYCADLAGASIAGPLLIAGLAYLTPQAMVVAATVLAGLASLCFASSSHLSNQWRYLGASTAAMLIVLAGIEPAHLKLFARYRDVELIRWSPTGRVVLSRYTGPPVTWAKCDSVASHPIPQKCMFIDAGAFTVMTAGNLSESDLAPVKRDVTAIANRLRPGRNLFVIGVGGGRDILTGQLYEQKRIDGVEVNPAIVSLLKHEYSTFNGQLAQQPGVNIINDEARSWLARSGRRYSVIQCSLVDTWAASSSGAFMLAENVLYTREAFYSYLNHLEKDGLLCCLRWGDAKESSELLRMLYLAKDALKQLGNSNTEIAQHIVLLSATYGDNIHHIGTMLVCPTPFSSSDIQQVLSICQSEGYQPLLVPGKVGVEPFASAISTSLSDPGMPTDDRPFFFTPINPQQGNYDEEPVQGQGLRLLFITLGLAAFLAVGILLIPLRTVLPGKLGSFHSALIGSIYFAALGAGFMLVEVALIQRLTTVLGNPSYGLSVVLLALLLASSAGSYTSQKLVNKGGKPKFVALAALMLATVSLVTCAILFANLLPSLESSSLSLKTAITLPLVCIPGLFMGCGFPLGLCIFPAAPSNTESCTTRSWYWAVNGAASVLASVVAAIISVMYGISTTILLGAASYLVACMAICCFRPSRYRGGPELLE